MLTPKKWNKKLEALIRMVTKKAGKNFAIPVLLLWSLSPFFDLMFEPFYLMKSAMSWMPLFAISSTRTIARSFPPSMSTKQQISTVLYWTNFNKTRKYLSEHELSIHIRVFCQHSSNSLQGEMGQGGSVFFRKGLQKFQDLIYTCGDFHQDDSFWWWGPSCQHDFLSDRNLFAPWDDCPNDDVCSYYKKKVEDKDLFSKQCV